VWDWMVQGNPSSSSDAGRGLRTLCTGIARDCETLPLPARCSLDGVGKCAGEISLSHSLRIQPAASTTERPQRLLNISHSTSAADKSTMNLCAKRSSETRVSKFARARRPGVSIERSRTRQRARHRGIAAELSCSRNCPCSNSLYTAAAACSLQRNRLAVESARVSRQHLQSCVEAGPRHAGCDSMKCNNTSHSLSHVSTIMKDDIPVTRRSRKDYTLLLSLRCVMHYIHPQHTNAQICQVLVSYSRAPSTYIIHTIETHLQSLYRT